MTTASTATGITSTSSVTSTSGGGDLCSDPNGLYAHSTDCQKYYQCAHGTPYEYSCPSSLLWNNDLKVCDWPANVQCTQGIRKYYHKIHKGTLIEKKSQKDNLL